MIGTVTVNPSIDQHILIDQLIKDDAIRASDIWRDPGGKGINVSRVIKALGGETVAFGISGGCAGYMLKSLMYEHEIPFDFVEVEQETRINMIITDQSDRTQTRVSAPGPKIGLGAIDRLMAKLLKHKPFPKWWVLGGSLPPGVPSDFYSRVIERLNEYGVKTVLDADGEALKLGVQASPYVIKPNEYEFERLTGCSLENDDVILQAASNLIHQGVGIVALSLGKRGALIVNQDVAFKVIGPDVEVKSKVGAGDSFIAGIVLSLSHGHTLEDAIRTGVAAGTAAVMTEGTQLCRKEDVDRIISEVFIERLEVPREISQPKKPKR